MQRMESSARPFKQRKSLATRMHEVTEIRIKYPNKIPVVVERYQKEKNLPPLSRSKFLVSQDLPLSQFAVTLRTRLCLAPSQTFYLLVNNRGLPNMTATMQELYRDHKDEDGFLYLTYASQEVFGSSCSGGCSAASCPLTPRPSGCSSCSPHPEAQIILTTQQNAVLVHSDPPEAPSSKRFF
ncbi:microtubule-associated proteins 1A/1B light chain 3C-like [Dromaius novaehollandiae]|uniref:microtubule-associated proteins 1A/1B light chain 3C-like n=1 Tax=Dromaius novaehollandiae TaxID=8790 RepID=UPI000E1E89BE|nr:microtubule-associated proteins 1A/1B light chain 3C-like [Dromaius novaehollandiae]